MPESLLETWQARGIEIVQGYGLTEAAPNVLCLPPEEASRRLGFAGKPYPHVEVALRDAETVRSSTVPRPASSSSAARTCSPATGGTTRRRRPSRDGWLATGDVAERDEEGFYRIAGRIKDMVISGGRTSIRRRSRPSCTRTTTWSRPQSSASRTRAGVRPAQPLSYLRAARRRARRRSPSIAARGLRASRCRRRSPSSRAAAIVDGQGAEGRPGASVAEAAR